MIALQLLHLAFEGMIPDDPLAPWGCQRGEHRIRDLNDEINKDLREKGYWEDQPLGEDGSFPSGICFDKDK